MGPTRSLWDWRSFQSSTADWCSFSISDASISSSFWFILHSTSLVRMTFDWYRMGWSLCETRQELNQSRPAGFSQFFRLGDLGFKCNELSSSLGSSCTAPKSRILLDLKKLPFNSLVTNLTKSSHRSTMVRLVFEAFGQG